MCEFNSNQILQKFYNLLPAETFQNPYKTILSGYSQNVYEQTTMIRYYC